MDTLEKCDRKYMVEQLRQIASRIEKEKECTDEMLRVRKFLIDQMSHSKPNKEYINALFLGFYIQRIFQNNLVEQ